MKEIKLSKTVNWKLTGRNIIPTEILKFNSDTLPLTSLT